MSTSGNRFKHESMQDSDSIVHYLQALSEGFSQGALMFSTDGKRLVFKPEGLIALSVEAKRKGEQVKLTLKLRWSEGEAHDGEDQPLLIEPLRSR